MTDLERARAWVQDAKAIVVAAGAGMGVDSGLPDFRGTEGFWRAYPPYQKAGLSFEAIANPRWFRDDPAFAWGFYGHRLNLYRQTVPHAGFDAIKRLQKPTAVFTSNVDGQFQKAGFDTIYECHGSIHWLQCLNQCGPLFAAGAVDVDPHTFRAREPMPKCPRCGALARPAILMFGDGEWNSSRSDAQAQQLHAFMQTHDALIIECGAGTAVPSVRHFSERSGARLIRINVRESEVPSGQIGLPMGAREALCALV